MVAVVEVQLTLAHQVEGWTMLTQGWFRASQLGR